MVLICPCKEGKLNNRKGSIVWQCATNSNHQFTMEDLERLKKRGTVLSGESAIGIKVGYKYEWDEVQGASNTKREVFPVRVYPK